MYRPHRYFRRGSTGGYYRGFRFGRYVCEDCRIVCSSSKQLEQHLNGTKHKSGFFGSSYEEESTFPLEHMVVLDQTEEDLPNENAASPASCDSSDSDFHTIDGQSHMVILDETNDDNDHPASPASCDSSDGESAPSSPATVKTTDETPKKKPKIDMTEDDQYAPESSSVPEGEAGTSEWATSQECHTKRGKTRHKELKKTFNIPPVKSNHDVFQFMDTFAITNGSDLEFATKVKEMFSKALSKYNERKLEEIICTEAENSSPEDLEESDDGSSDHGQTNSITEEPIKSECERINSAPNSPTNSSPTQCISIPAFSADHKADLHIVKQSENADTSSIASRSPTNKCEDIDTSNKPSTATDDNTYSATEADLLMESESCVTAEASCSDEDV